MASTLSPSDLAAAVPTLTAFSPDPSCTNDIYFLVDQEEDCGDDACRLLHLGYTTSDSDCFPSQWSTEVGAFISPGFCPEGYEPACGQSDDDDSETTATCCPNSYTCQTNNSLHWYTTDLCYRLVPDSITYMYTTSTSGGAIETSSGSGGAINAFGIVIRWQSSDLTAASAVQETSSPSSSAEANDAAFNSSGLSTGAIAGITVGVVLAAILFVLGAFLMWRRRKGHRGTGAAVPLHPDKYITPELSSVSDYHELYSQSPRSAGFMTANELHGQYAPQELATSRY